MPDLDGDELAEGAARPALTAHALLDGRGVLSPYTEQPLAARGDENAAMIARGDPVWFETVATWRAGVFGCEFDIDNVAVKLAAATIGPGEDDDTVIARPAARDNRMAMWVCPDGVLPHHLGGEDAEAGASQHQTD